MGVRRVEIAGRALSIQEADHTIDPATGRALTGSWLWESALHLAEFVASQVPVNLDLAGKTVLELGAGATGLPGLVAATLGAAGVVLTDVGPLLPGLKANAEVNGLGCAEVRELEWGSEYGKAVDLVLMSDVFYEPEEMPALARTLRSVCGEETRVWAASEVRASAGECMERLREEGFEVEEMPKVSRWLLRRPEERSEFVVYVIGRLVGEVRVGSFL